MNFPANSATSQTPRPRIVVLDDWERGLDRLADWSPVRAAADVDFHHAPLKGQALVDVASRAHALVLSRDRTPLDAELLARLPLLKYVVFTGGRNRRIDYAALKARGIAVSGTPGGPGTESTVEQTWSMILAASRRLESAMAAMRNGGWRTDAPWPMASVLSGERLGLLGFGNIGGKVGAVGKALGMEVVTWSPNMTPARAEAAGVTFVELDELLATSKVVSLHLVPSPSTVKLIDAARLSTMRKDSILVNTSRPNLIDRVALLQALQSRTIGCAALDVFDVEPLPADDPMRRLDNVVLTPHVGFVAEQVYAKFAAGIVDALGAWLEERPLPNLITDA